MTTVAWLHDSLQYIVNAQPVNRLARVWSPVAGFSQGGVIFCIYRDIIGYCVHVGEEWAEDEEPKLGYFSKDLSWNDLIDAIAAKYDALRK